MIKIEQRPAHGKMSNNWLRLKRLTPLRHFGYEHLQQTMMNTVSCPSDISSSGPPLHYTFSI